MSQVDEITVKDSAGVDRLVPSLAPLIAANHTDLAAILAKISADPATQTTLAALLAKVIAAPSTEAKQDAIIALLTTQAGYLDGVETALGVLGTQTTLAAILAKIIAAPSTEAKQDATNSLLTAIGALLTTQAGYLDGVETALGTLGTLGTQTTLAAVLAKLSADPATQTTLAAVLAKISADPATQTTLAAVLSALGSPMQSSGGSFTPATAVNVATGSTLVMAANANRKPGSFIICNTTAVSRFGLGNAAVATDPAVDGMTNVPGVFYVPDGFKGAVYAIGVSATGTWRPVEATE